MNKIKLILVFILLTCIATVFAQTASVGFRDATTGTRTLVRLQDPAYPNATPVGYARFLIQMYKSTDSVIDPLGSDGLPTGDDIVALPSSPASGNMTLAFGPTGTWAPSSYVFATNGGVGNTWQGDKVYLRIFNAGTIAAATAYVEFNGLYTVPATGTYLPSILVAPINNWSSWITKDVTPLVSGAITSALPVNGVTVACTGQASVTTTVTGLFSFSVAPGTDITITPSKINYSFEPAFRSYTNVLSAITGVDFAMTYINPNAATTPAPTNGEINVPVTVGQLQWQFTPQSGYSLPTDFKVYFPADATVPTIVPYVPATTNYSIPVTVLAYNTIYTWRVVPYNALKGKSVEGNLSPMTALSDNAKGDAQYNTWAFTTEFATDWLNPEGTVNIDPAGNGSMGIFVFESPAAAAPVILLTLVPIEGLVFPGSEIVTDAFAVNMNASGTTTLTITVPAGIWYVIAYYSGAWQKAEDSMGALHYPVLAGDTDRTVYFFDVPFGTKGDVPLVFSGGGDPTLPVELSSFTAVLTSQYFINLTWVTESETQVSGFYIYRSEDNNFGNALCLNPANIVPATNTSQQQSYTMTDTEELVANQTYYYWLDSIDLGGSSSLHGPISATVTGQPIPELPEISAMSNAYPNPFRMGTSTSINVNIKAGETGTVSIYNVRGQLVETFKVKPGINKLTWNAKGCGSGIYLQKLSTPSVNNTKKLVIIN